MQLEDTIIVFSVMATLLLLIYFYGRYKEIKAKKSKPEIKLRVIKVKKNRDIKATYKSGKRSAFTKTGKKHELRKIRIVRRAQEKMEKKHSISAGMNDSSSAQKREFNEQVQQKKDRYMDKQGKSY